MLPWGFWLTLALMWLGWGVYQVVYGHVWFALGVDVVCCGIYLYLAVLAKKRSNRSKA